MMRSRRHVVCALIALLTPRVAARESPPAKVYRIGWLSAGPPIDALWKVFTDGLRERGWIEGKNISFEVLSSEGQSERLPRLAEELVHRNVDLIVTAGTPPTVAASKVTTTIPIVFWSVGDPVGAGVVDRLARPGRNATGTGALGPAQTVKTLEILKEAVPKASRIAMFSNDAFPFHVAIRPEIDATARRLRLTLTPIQVGGPEDLDEAFATVARGNFDALLILGQPFLAAERARIAKFALDHRLPAISPFNIATEAGLLLSYGSRFVDDLRRVPDYIDRILRGAKPADLPVEQPTTFHLVINLRTADAIGAAVPPSLIRRADHVIR